MVIIMVELTVSDGFITFSVVDIIAFAPTVWFLVVFLVAVAVTGDMVLSFVILAVTTGGSLVASLVGIVPEGDTVCITVSDAALVNIDEFLCLLITISLKELTDRLDDFAQLVTLCRELEENDVSLESIVDKIDGIVAVVKTEDSDLLFGELVMLVLLSEIVSSNELLSGVDEDTKPLLDGNAKPLLVITTKR